ncbi:MAG: molybdate ABC transporter substrate-binding protein [Deltaproteobacteria bacterium]|nr:molybdate ABC transporter substrate-binding protein [Deltaproteobacteria bacterium]
MKKRWTFGLLVFIVIFGVHPLFGQTLKKARLMVFAAASTTDAVTRICEIFAKREGQRVITAFAASSTLAKQVEYGAPADIFISANLKWMDFLEKKELIVPSSRFNLLRNRIVLIAPVSSPIEHIEMSKNTDLVSMLQGGRLAMGDPDHVPAGIYGEKALDNLGLFSSLKGKIARTKDVRAALALVERGEAPLGLVYQTDAAITSKVKIVGVFPGTSHPPVCYPAAIVQGHETDQARRFILFLKSQQVKVIFKKYGFLIYK